MAASEVIKHLYDGSLEIADGTGVPVLLSLAFSIGDFKLSGLSADQGEVKPYKIRGKLQTLRTGPSSEPSGSFSAYLADVSDVADQTLIDFVLKKGSYNGNKSTTTNGDAYTVDLTWTIEGTDLGDVADHVITCTDCVVTMDLSEGEPNTIAFSFTVFGSVTMT